jgi:hypothetical protein
MSPVSKKRRRKGKPARVSAPGAQGLRAHLDRIDASMRSLRVSTDPLGSEAYASQLVASFVDAHGGLDRETVSRFLAAVRDRSTAESMALLRVCSSNIPDFELRAIAGAYADALAAEHVAEPRWIGELGRTRSIGTHEFADVYGDQRTIMCTYAGPTEPHALIGFVNTSHLGGHLEDIVLTTAIDRAMTGFTSRASESDGMITFGSVSPGHAHSLLATALANSYRTDGMADEVLTLRALLGARLAMTAPESSMSTPVVEDAEDIERRFLDSTALARHKVVPHDPIVGVTVSALVRFGVEFDSGRITRSSPTKLRAFAQWFASEGTTSIRASAPTLRAWVDWILVETQARDLPPTAKTQLIDTLDEFLPAERPATIALDLGLDELLKS